MQNTSQSFWRSWNNDLESYTLGIQLHVSECYLVKITNLGDGKWSNEGNVITNHSFDTVETVSNEGKSASCVQKEDTWESNTTNNSTEWNSSNNTFLKLIVTTVRAVQWLLRSGNLNFLSYWRRTWLICAWNPGLASIWCFIQNILSFGISALLE